MGADYPQISNFSISFIDANHHDANYVIYGYTIPIVSAFVTTHPNYPIKKWKLTGGGINKSGDFYINNNYAGVNFHEFGDVFRAWGNAKLTLTVEDTRGESASITSDDIYVNEYNRPLINSFSAHRVDENGIDTADGEYIKVNVSATPSSIKDIYGEEVNTLSCYVSWKKTSESSYGLSKKITNTEPWHFAADNGFNYDVKIMVRDKFLETVAYCAVLGDNKDLNLAEGGGGAAIGTKAEKGYFDVAYNSRFQKGISANDEISSKKGVVSTGTNSKGDFLTFGSASRIAAWVSPGGTYYGENLNDYTAIGVYGVYYASDINISTAWGAVIHNIPCEKPGTLRVYSATGNMDSDATEQYLMQEYVVYDGSAVYRRCLSKVIDSSNSTWPTDWTVGEWICYSGAQCGTTTTEYGTWKYKMHSDGDCEIRGIFTVEETETRILLPENMLTQVDCCFCSLNIEEKVSFIPDVQIGAFANQTSVTVRASRRTSGAGFVVSLLVKGRWK